MESLSPEPNAQEIAFHTAWMRRLARALVADSATAEDVVQDAWVKLARRRAPLGTGYLAAVVRTLAWTRHRGEQARILREAAGAPSEALPSTAEVSARVEIATRVAQALEGLPEPYRTTLVLRYYDDLSAAEIARRAGIPAATVRARLKRGLEALRDRLDEGSHGRAGWVSALLPLTRSEVGASGVLLTTVSSVLAMKFVLGTLIAVFALALTWHFAVRSAGADGPPTAVVPPAQPPADADPTRAGGLDGTDTTRTIVAEVSSAAEERPPATPTIAETFQIRARAIDGGDRPIAGAWLGLDLLPERSDISGSDGQLTISLDTGAIERLASLNSNRSVVLQVGAPGYRRRSVRGTLSMGASSLELGDVMLDPGGPLLGRVMDDHGLGVEGALLVFDRPIDVPPDDEQVARAGPDDSGFKVGGDFEFPVTARSGPGGAFRLDGVPPGHGSLWARTDRSLWAFSRPIGIRPGEEVAGIEIVVRESADRVITGRVVDPGGAPLPGIELTFRNSGNPDTGWWTGRTDMHGEFHFAPVDGRVMDIRAQAPDWGWEDLVRSGVPPGTHDLVLTFVESAWLTVEARGLDGEHLLDGRVYGLPAEGPTVDSSPRYEAWLDADGRARLRKPQDALRVRIEAPGYRSVLLGPFEPASFPEPLVATLEALPAIVGQVLRPDGSPAAGALVSLHRGASNNADTGQPYHLTQQGWPGDGEPFVYRLFVEAQISVSANDDGRFRLPLPGVDSGAVGEVARPKDPLGSMSILERNSQLMSTKADQPWYVHVAIAGEATLTSGPHLVQAAQDFDLDLRLERGGSIAGRLTLEGGRSPAGWTMVASDALAETADAQVAPDGSFHLDHLHAGGWQIQAFEPGLRYFRAGGKLLTKRVPELNVQVETGRTTDYGHASRPRENARLRGQLWIDGAPPGAWRVTLRTSTPQGAITTRETTLDPDGHFEIRLRPGLSTSLSFHGSHVGTQLSILAQPVIQVGDNDWSYVLATARIEGRVASTPAPGGMLGGPQYVVEAGELRITTNLTVDEQGHFGPLTVGAGSGILRGPQTNIREPGPIWAEPSLAPGETLVLDLR
jgi:RNA polymerase sigma factor (sigma-70 family)